MIKENTTTSVGVPHSGPDGETMGIPFFKCDSTTYNNCIQGRDKGKHWKKFIKDEGLSGRIKEYMTTNKGKQFMLKDSTTGAMVFADKRFKI